MKLWLAHLWTVIQLAAMIYTIFCLVEINSWLEFIPAAVVAWSVGWWVVRDSIENAWRYCCE